MSSYKISVKNLSKNFGNKQVLSNVNLNIKSGESIVIIGGSGTGKSVLIKIISTLLQASSGVVAIDGKNIFNFNEKEKDQLMGKLGFLFQGSALFDSLTIWENISFRLIHKNKISKQQAREIAIQKLKLVGLGERVADLYPSELSGGMQKRAALARCIATDPEIIFFDEPTTGLDPIMSSVISNLIAENSRKLGATTITITHDMHAARTIADKVAMLYEGKIIWFGDVKDLDSSGNTYVDQFIHGRGDGPIKLIV